MRWKTMRAASSEAARMDCGVSGLVRSRESCRQLLAAFERFAEAGGDFELALSLFLHPRLDVGPIASRTLDVAVPEERE